MKETNYIKIEKIFKNNGEYITRKDINDLKISSWFLTDFVKKNKLIKLAPGIYASENYLVDEYFILQKRYPKFIFSGMSALFLHGLTDKIVNDITVCAPQGYNPTRIKMNNVNIHRISDNDIYSLGIKEIKTMFGNVVKVYDEERTICDLIKFRESYDSETFIKAIKVYIKDKYNEIKLFRYAKVLKIEKQLFEVLEILINYN